MQNLPRMSATSCRCLAKLGQLRFNIGPKCVASCGQIQPSLVNFGPFLYGNKFYADRGRAPPALLGENRQDKPNKTQHD